MFVRGILTIELFQNIDVSLIKYVIVTKSTGYFQNERSEHVFPPHAVIDTDNFGK
jgi:hypothetical protein